MRPPKPTTAILHYTAPPVVGGVEGVMEAHARIFAGMGYPVTLIAGRGSAEGLPDGVDLVLIPGLDTQDPDILAAAKILEDGQVPQNFDALVGKLRDALAETAVHFDNLIVHNIFTKHFNLPLTAAVFELLDAGLIRNCIAWHHDFTWTSPRSRSKVHPGYPWDLLRTYRADVSHVTISQERREELAGLYRCPVEAVKVIYNGVDPREMFGLTGEGWELIQRLDLPAADLLLLMPVRVTRLKNIEYALEVVKALKEQGHAVKLVLTGPPDPHDEQSMDYFRTLQKMRDDLGLELEMHFVFESGPAVGEPYRIGLDVVADLYRIADLLFMPSRQEGFGMPVLEAGLLGLAVAASTAVPAAREIGGADVLRFDLDQPPQQLARELWAWAKADKRRRLAHRVRQNYTWQVIFEREIKPLLHTAEDRVRQKIGRARHVWLFLDYDGTLADFAPTPEDILPDEDLIALIKRLAGQESTRVTIISGRRLAHIQALLPISNILLAGTYGLELQTPDGETVQRLDYGEIRPFLDELQQDWEQILAGRSGFFLEDKGWTLAIHAKDAAEDQADSVLAEARRAANALLDQAAPDLFRLQGGHRFLECSPLAADKKRSVNHILSTYPRHEDALLVYLGDDDKDEVAFSAIQEKGGVVVAVGERLRSSTADHWLPSPQAARQWLHAIAEARG